MRARICAMSLQRQIVGQSLECLWWAKFRGQGLPMGDTREIQIKKRRRAQFPASGRSRAESRALEAQYIYIWNANFTATEP